MRSIYSKTYLNTYKASFINERIKYNRIYYDILIKNLKDNLEIVFTEFSPSPMLVKDKKQSFDKSINDALHMITSMSMEYHDDNREEFKDIYDNLIKVMSYEDIEELDLYFYDIENPPE